MSIEDLVLSLEKSGVLKTLAIRDALLQADRRDFVPEEFAPYAYEDTALLIGEGQAISQPYTVVFMLELLQPDAGDAIMDIGYGSGWQAALLAAIAGDAGKIYALELVKGLCDLGKANVEKYPDLVKRVKFYCRNAESGLPEEAEKIGGFDAIIAAAELSEVPRAWRKQLKVGGRMVYPKAGSIFREMKHGPDKFKSEEHPGFAFVPFIERG